MVFCCVGTSYKCVLLQRVDLHYNNDGYERKGE